MSENDRWQNRHYEECERDVRADTAGHQPARCALVHHRREGEKVVRGADAGNPVQRHRYRPQKCGAGGAPAAERQLPAGIRAQAGPGGSFQSLTDEEYDARRKALQKRLTVLHNRTYRKKVPVIIVYEGWDAAGKGGNIRRVTAALDPRGYQVNPIASPEPHEKARHYLWRFWTRLPKTGHIAIFDRSWYGRVMVERIEGFCTENDWQRAYNEINEFEAELINWGAVILKFWVHIDPDTQLERFNSRQSTPEKQWKITDEDWRNREKWPAYEQAVDEMLQKTSTQKAPWHILPSNDKKFAASKRWKSLWIRWKRRWKNKF